MDNPDLVVVALARTPFGRFQGALQGIEAPRLAAAAINATLARSALAATEIDVLYGGAAMIGCHITPLRQSLLLSKLPETTPSALIDRACCSGMTAIGMAMKDIRLGEARAALCGGFESLSTTPNLLSRKRANRIGDVTLSDPLLMRSLVVDRPVPVYSGDEALRHGVDRGQQDEWALSSHQRYFAAKAVGYFDFELFALTQEGDRQSCTLQADESPRADTNLEKLSLLKPVYNGKTVTAGNAPGLNDGAAFLLVTRRDFALERGLEPLARLIDYAQVCGGPTTGTSTPAHAIKKIAERNARDPTDWDLIEINEAYAATPLVSTLVLAGGDASRAAQLRKRTNVHGGAVAIGHPPGATGARLVMTLINGLRRRGGGRGVAAICGGFGQGDALMLEVT